MRQGARLHVAHSDAFIVDLRVRCTDLGAGPDTAGAARSSSEAGREQHRAEQLRDDTPGDATPDSFRAPTLLFGGACAAATCLAAVRSVTLAVTVLVAALIALSARSTAEEAVVAVRGVGISVKCHRRFPWPTRETFVREDCVVGPLIYERVTVTGVRAVLAVLVKDPDGGAERLVTLFRRSDLRLRDMQTAYRLLHRVMPGTGTRPPVRRS
ncbi:unnamed protein product [Pedinophyceae sp. YPF-701]|nr:unnamed protein product [Pedinophyceae sp. YPF-701]